MKEPYDYAIIHRINEHFSDLNEDISNVDSFERFIGEKEKRRAILFDFLQIGELLNQLSDPFLKSFGNKHAYDIISIRNRIVHGYSTIRDDIIYNTLKHELHIFINELNEFSLKRYKDKVRALIGANIKTIIDRPAGTIHKDIKYELNYGYTEKLTALDGEYQDVYLIGTVEGNIANGTVVAVIDRDDDIENKLVVSTDSVEFTEEEIEHLVGFQEKHFKHSIIK